MQYYSTLENFDMYFHGRLAGHAITVAAADSNNPEYPSERKASATCSGVAWHWSMIMPRDFPHRSASPVSTLLSTGTAADNLAGGVEGESPPQHTSSHNYVPRGVPLVSTCGACRSRHPIIFFCCQKIMMQMISEIRVQYFV